MFEKGLFGDMFDFNGDGKLDDFEQAAYFGMFCHLMEESEKSGVKEELKSYNLDPDDLELMDEDELIEAMEEAGLDPDDYDLD